MLSPAVFAAGRAESMWPGWATSSEFTFLTPAAPDLTLDTASSSVDELTRRLSRSFKSPLENQEIDIRYMINHINISGQRKLVVVLGMPRSGTSATTRALPVFGVRLGDNLMEARPGINDKGFWEDLDVFGLNIELMRELQVDWQSHGPIPLQNISTDKLAAFRLRASALLRERTADSTPFGFKDPRTSRLLGFWRPIFDHLELDQGYVISLRDPLSVARSLATAWGYGTEKSCYLWLEYVVDAMRGSRGTRRLVVDFDAIIADPAGQLRRISSKLGFPPPDEQSPEFREYADTFLDESLRHARFETEDLRLDPAVPQDAINAYAMLRRVSRDEISIDDPEVAALFDRLRDSLEHMAPALMQMRRQDSAIHGLTQTIAARDAEIARLQHELHGAQLGLQAVQQELHVARHECSEQNSRIAQLAAEVAQGEQHARELQAQLVNQATRIDELERSEASMQTSRAEAEQVMQERIRSLDDEVRRREESLAEMRESTSWKVTAPLRAVGRLLK